jgi:hypothetical protein
MNVPIIVAAYLAVAGLWLLLGKKPKLRQDRKAPVADAEAADCEEEEQSIRSRLLIWGSGFIGFLLVFTSLSRPLTAIVGSYRQTNQPIYGYQRVAFGCLMIGFSIWTMINTKTENE